MGETRSLRDSALRKISTLSPIGDTVGARRCDVAAAGRSIEASTSVVGRVGNSHPCGQWRQKRRDESQRGTRLVSAPRFDTAVARPRARARVPGERGSVVTDTRLTSGEAGLNRGVTGVRSKAVLAVELRSTGPISNRPAGCQPAPQLPGKFLLHVAGTGIENKRLDGKPQISFVRRAGNSHRYGQGRQKRRDESRRDTRLVSASRIVLAVARPGGLARVLAGEAE